MVDKPTDEQLAALLSEHAARFPEKARVVLDDDGEDVVVPLLLGVPTGACDALAGLASPVWDDVVATAFRMRPDAEEDTDALVADCVLYPDSGTWATLVERWPALPQVVQVVLRQKLGATLKQIEDPGALDEPPAPLAPLLAAHRGATWRRYHLKGEDLAVALRVPDAGVYKLFFDAIRRRNAPAARLARDFAQACTLGVVRADGSALEPGDMYRRWPGIALTVGSRLMGMAGMAADADLGNW